MSLDMIGLEMADGGFDILQAIRAERDETAALYRQHLNPQFARLQALLGFDRTWTRGEGAHLWDEGGNRYLDCLGGYAMLNVGRAHPVVRKALRDVLDSAHPNWVQFDQPPLAATAAHELVRRVGRGLERVFFCNSGTEGVEAALKFARAATKRRTFICCERGFHGLTCGALSLNGNAELRSRFEPLLQDVVEIPFDDLPALERELAQRDIAAFIVEPVQGKGVRIPSSGYLAECARLCHRRGALFIVDEVQTGVGRTGRFLGIDHEPNAEPDIVVLSKGLAGGEVPVGAVLLRDAIWRCTFDSLSHALMHASTFHQGNLAMAAVLATLHVVDHERLAERAARLGERIAHGLRANCDGATVRQRGLLIAIDLDVPLPSLVDTIRRRGEVLVGQSAVARLLERHRVLCQVASSTLPSIKITPPLVIDEADVDWIIEAMRETSDAVRRPLPLLARQLADAVRGRRIARVKPATSRV